MGENEKKNIQGFFFRVDSGYPEPSLVCICANPFLFSIYWKGALFYCAVSSFSNIEIPILENKTKINKLPIISIFRIMLVYINIYFLRNAMVRTEKELEIKARSFQGLLFLIFEILQISSSNATRNPKTTTL